MTLRVTVDTKPAEGFLNRLFREQIPFATARALNQTALDVQQAEREELSRNFTLRRRDWAMRNIKIRREDFARKHRLRAIVRVESPGGGDRSDILAKFEEGGIKRPSSGKRIAVPVDVRRTGTGIVSPSMRPGRLNFQPRGGKVFSNRSNVMVGDKRTVMIRQPGGRGVVLQRKGRRKARKLLLLYAFRPKVKLSPRLKFESTARREINQVFNKNFDREFRRAIETAR